MSNPSTKKSSTNFTGQGTTADTSTTQPQQMAQSAKAQAQQTAQSVQTQARNAANAQMSQASQGLDEFAHSVREFSQDLRGRNQGMMAEVTGRAADQIERVADYMQRDVGQMTRDLSRYASRQPIVFLAGAFVIGFLGSRFLKSSGEQDSGNAMQGRMANDQNYRYGKVNTTPGVGALPTTGSVSDVTTDYDYPPTPGNGVM